MKVVQIIARLNVGGPAHVVTSLNAALDARGHTTVLVHGTLDRGEADAAHLASRHRLATIRLPHLRRPVSPVRDIRTLASLVALLARETPDVVHTHTAKAGTLGRTAAWLFNLTRGRADRCLVVHTYHGHVFTGYFSAAAARAIRIVERRLARITDHIVTLSVGQQREIVDTFAIADADRTVVVPIGLELDELLQLTSDDARTAKAAAGARQDDVVVGYVGRMVPIKNLEHLLRAFSIAAAQDPRLVLWLAGDGPTRRQLEALAAGLGLQSRVRFLGWRNDLTALYGAIDICTLTSLNEGTPVALIEAMAAGKPAVATAVGGVDDVVEHGISGLLVRSGDAEAFAKSILQLAADPAARQRMGEAGRQRVRERYSAAASARATETLYARGLAELRREGGRRRAT